MYQELIKMHPKKGVLCKFHPLDVRGFAGFFLKSVGSFLFSLEHSIYFAWAKQMISQGTLRQVNLMICLMVLFLPGSTPGQIRYLNDDPIYTGTTALSFLRVPVGARSQSMGGRNITSDEQGTALYWNPGILAFVPDFWTSFSHTDILGVYNQQYLAGILPLKERAAWGLSAQVMGGTIDGRNIYEEKISSIHLDLALGGGVGIELWPGKLGGGLRLDLIRSQIMEATAHAPSLTLGFLYKPLGDFRVGAVWSHISPGVKYNTSVSQTERFPQKILLEMGKVKGVGDWSWSFGLYSTIEGEHRYYGGVEYWPVSLLALRSGYEYTSNDNDLNFPAGVSTGAGLAINQVLLDFAWQWFPPIGSNLSAALHYKVPSRSKLTEVEWYLRAKDAFDRGRLRTAEEQVKKSIQINPRYWEAVSLLARIRLEKNKSSNKYLTLIYTANSDGQLGPVEIEGKIAGGVARRATVIRELQDKYAHRLLVDAGNIFPAGMDKEWSGLLYQVYGLLGYDALGFSTALLEKDQKGRALSRVLALGLPEISSHAEKLSNVRNLPRFRRIRTGQGVDVLVLALVESNQLADSLRVNALSPPLQALQELSTEVNKEGQLTLVLFYGTALGAKQLASRFPDIDVIILASTRELFLEPLVSGSTLILSPGEGGAAVGALSLRIGENSSLNGFTHQIYTLDSKVKPDPEIAKLVSPLVWTGKENGSGNWGQDVTGSGLVYVKSDNLYTSQRVEPVSGQIMFWEPKKAAHSLSPNGKKCYQPVFIPAEYRVLYVCEEEGVHVLYSQNPESPQARILSKNKWGYGRVRTAGKGMAYVHEKSEQGGLLYRYDMDRGSRTALFGEKIQDIVNFDISPTQGLWVFQRRNQARDELWLFEEKAQTLLRISDPTVDAQEPRWSRDGNEIVFKTKATANHGEGLYIFSLDGQKAQLISEQNKLGSFAWRYDQQELVFTAGANILDIYKWSRQAGESKWGQVRLDNEPVSYNKIQSLVVGGKPGFVVEAAQENSVVLIWISDTLEQQKVIVGPSGFNYLP